MIPPAVRSNSAEKLFVCTLNSSVASTAGIMATPPIAAVVAGSPSTSTSLALESPPFAEKLPHPV